jgi:hypothetical protein
LSEQFSESQPGFGASFRVFECRNKLFEEGSEKGFLNLVSFLREAIKNLVFDFPSNKDTKTVLNPQAHIEKVY